MAQDYVKVGEVDDIHPSQTKAVQVGSDTVCIVNIDGKFYAIGNTCIIWEVHWPKVSLKVTKFNVLGMALSLMLEQDKLLNLLRQLQNQSMKLK